MENQHSQVNEQHTIGTQQPNTIVSSPETNTPQPTPPQKSNSMKVVIIILVIIVLVLLGTLAYVFGFKNSQSNLSNSKSNANSQNGVNNIQTTIKSLPSPTPDPTANWKTFTNTSLNYSFKYPSTASVSELSEKSSQYQMGNNVTIAIHAYPNSVDFGADAINISVTKIPSNITIEQAVKNGYSGTNTYDYSSLQFKQITIGGISGVRSANGIPAMEYAENAFVIKDNNLYSFELSYKNLSDKSSYENLFDQFLSTFNFITQNQTNSTDTSTWKTYTNEKLNLQVKYPTNYQTQESTSSVSFIPTNYTSLSNNETLGIITIEHLPDKVDANTNMEDYIQNVLFKNSFRGEVLKSITAEQMGNIPAYSVTTVDHPDDKSSQIFVKAGNSIYYFIFQVGGNPNNLASQAINYSDYGSLISTFKLSQ